MESLNNREPVPVKEVVATVGPQRSAADDNGRVRISLKVDYALRAMAQIAADGGDEPVKAEEVATAQDIPLKYLLGILNELKRARLLRSQRGTQGGFSLTRPATEIALADVIRALDGPLADVHDESLTELSYPGVAASLVDVWMALRTALRDVFETVTLAHLVEGELPGDVAAMAEQYRADVRY